MAMEAITWVAAMSEEGCSLRDRQVWFAHTIGFAGKRHRYPDDTLADHSCQST